MAVGHWITKRNRRPKNTSRAKRSKKQIAKTMAKLRELERAEKLRTIPVAGSPEAVAAIAAAEQDIANGNYVTFGSSDELIASLK